MKHIKELAEQLFKNVCLKVSLAVSHDALTHPFHIKIGYLNTSVDPGKLMLFFSPNFYFELK